jgi:uncharacterized protein YkwD
MKRQAIKTFAVLFMAATAAIAVPSAAQAAKLSVKSCVLSKGDRIDINVKGKKETKGTYKSSNQKVATVSKKGVVKAKKVGAAQIIWKKGKTKYRAGLIVVKAPKLDKSKLSVKEGKSKTVSVSQFGNADLTAAWSSNDENVAVVLNGKITGVSEGSTLVTAQIKGKTKTYKRYVVVTVKKKTANAVTGTDTLPENGAADNNAGNSSVSIDNSTAFVPEVTTGTSIATGASVTTGTSIATGALAATGTSVTTGTSIGSTTGSAVIPGTGIPGAVNGLPETTGSAITGGSIGSSDETQAQVTGSAVKPGENASGGNSEPVNSGNTNQGSTNPGTDTTEKPAEKSMAEQVTELVNKERAAQGLSSLTLDAKLTACADIRAEELVDVFDHIRPDETLCFTVLDENDIISSSRAENIASGQRTAEAVMKSWMDSEGHRNNILGKSFSKIGVGYFNIGGTSYWVQLFTD